MSKTYGVSSDLSGRMSALQSKKMLLEKKIAEELKRPYQNSVVLTPLKLDKLHVKEEIETLRDVA